MTFNFRYMILCKIMNNSEDEVGNLLSAKLAVKYKGTEIDAMKVPLPRNV